MARSVSFASIMECEDGIVVGGVRGAEDIRVVRWEEERGLLLAAPLEFCSELLAEGITREWASAMQVRDVKASLPRTTGEVQRGA